MNLNNLRLSAKLWLAIALIVIGICAVTGITAMRSAADRLESAAALEDVSQKITLANRWVALIELNEARSQAILLSGDDQLEGVLKTPMDNTAAEVETLRRAIDASQLSVNDFVLMEKVAKARQRVLELRTQVGALRQNAQPEEAFVLLSSEYEPALAAYLKTLREFVATQTQVYKDVQGVYAQRAKTLIYFGVVGMLVLIVMILLGASWLIRSIQKPLQQANALASSIAQGDLSVQVDTGRGDEFGDLMKSMARMSESLGQMVQQVRHSTDSIALASSEIASGNNDLAQRTEQTSSNLQSAAASMDQLTQTVRHSADSARQAGTLASNASAVAEKGGEAVRQVVFTMEEINSSSRRIADIIGVIDGIAFQTNILALNAAVEAARAGEHGRGFAVVASEVRSLAQRSAEAAKEIKSLIGTSVEKVESGSRLVSDAGATMDDIVLSVRRVADVIGEISAAASEQSAGIAHVNQSVGQLDQMTQQNAALVEESAAAAESLKDQAGQLTQAVAVFRIASSGPSGVRRSPVASSGARPLTYQRAKAIERAKPLVAVQGRSAMKAVASNRPKVSGREGAGTAQAYTPSVAMSTKPARPQRPGAADAGDWESF